MKIGNISTYAMAMVCTYTAQGLQLHVYLVSIQIVWNTKFELYIHALSNYR